MAQTFYRLQMKEGSGGNTITDEVLSQNKITADLNYAGEGFAKLPQGSVVLVHKGSIPSALVKVLDRIPEADIEDPSFGVDYNVEVLSKYNDAVNEFPSIGDLWQAVPYSGTFAKVEHNNPTYKRINNWYSLVNTKRKMKEIINLLQIKPQVIFQGPPGTGKTRLAKLVAEELTKAKNIGSPLQVIDDFFKNFDSSNPEVKKKRQEINALLNTFQLKFPIVNLKNLTLTEYCTGKGDKNNFCWWIENGLKTLGKYSPGNSTHYLIYWKKDSSEYSKHGNLVKDIADDDQAMESLAGVIDEVVATKDIKKGTAYLGDSFLLKILNSYYPDEFFPINGRESLDNSLKLFNIDGSKFSKVEKNKKLYDLFRQKKKQFNKDVTAFEFMRFLFDTFNLKEGVELDTQHKAVSKGEFKLIQFHPAYTYEDFVRGITSKVSDGKVEYATVNRILADFAEKALDNPSSNYVLIIDEINRANLPAVLGELIYALEYRYDEENEEETSVEGVYEVEGDKKLRLPKNLYIIGTMNTADRSVGHIDYAIRRRFAFVPVLSDESVIENDRAKSLYREVEALFVEKDASGDRPSRYLASDFRPEDVMLGHSYFLGDDQEMHVKLDYEIKPILKEYLKDGILLGSAEPVINSLKLK